jgi:hypothetical protein
VAGKVPLARHLAALRAADKELAAERDRRYAEVAAEREKALALGAAKDEIALNLARDIQRLHDEKANNLQAQMAAERGQFATHAELRVVEEKLAALIKPLAEFVTGARQVGTTRRLDVAQVMQFAGLLIALAAAFFAIVHG